MKKSYKIKEIFYTLQGEGAQSGRPAIFCRFSKCNLWNGKEKDRALSACSFCDTDILGTDGRNGGEYISALDLAIAVNNLWPNKNGKPFVVCTGGEPALQLDEDLIENFHQLGFEVAIETNGTIPIDFNIDWVCVSPKHGSELIVKRGNELKTVFPQEGQNLNSFLDLDFEHLYLQPMDGIDGKENTTKTIQYCLEHPEWKLSIQQHKLIGMP